MIAATYSADPTWEPRYVLAVATPEGLVIRETPLGEAELGVAALAFDSAEKVGELRRLTGPTRLADWVRWKGLCVGLEELPDSDPASVFARPLAPRKRRAA